MEKQIKDDKLNATALVAARYTTAITFDVKPAAMIATIAPGAKGLAGDSEPAKKRRPEARRRRSRRRRASAASLTGGSQAQNTGTVASAGSRGVVRGSRRRRRLEQVEGAHHADAGRDRRPSRRASRSGAMEHYPGHLVMGVAALAATLAISSLTINRFVRRKLRLSLFLLGAYVLLNIVLVYVRAERCTSPRRICASSSGSRSPPGSSTSSSSA